MMEMDKLIKPTNNWAPFGPQTENIEIMSSALYSCPVAEGLLQNELKYSNVTHETEHLMGKDLSIQNWPSNEIANNSKSSRSQGEGGRQT